MDAADRAQVNELLWIAAREAELLAHAKRPMPALDPSRPCRDCGEAIGMDRVRAIPDAQRCIDCEVEHDRRKGKR